MQKSSSHSAEAWIISLLFVGLTIWWAVLFFLYNSENAHANLTWAASYQIIAILGGVFGLFSSRQWGGFKSVMGRAILMFSFGLLLQAFGQTTFSYYNLVAKIEIPYPSASDIGFFGSIPFYIYGIALLSKAAGARSSLRSFSGKLTALVLPLLMLAASYFFFLTQYEFDWSQPLKTFLDFGYPLGQAIYVSIALLTYILSKKFLGGIMKNYVLVILLALVVQYMSDFNFLYQTTTQTWQNGGYGDYLYLTSYFVMALGLIKLSDVFQKIRGGN